MSITSITAAQRQALRDNAVKTARAAQWFAQNNKIPSDTHAATLTATLTTMAAAMLAAGIGGGLIPVTGVTAAPKTASINQKQTQTYAPVIAPSNATNQSVTNTVDARVGYFLAATPNVLNAIQPTSVENVGTTATVTSTTADGGFTDTAALTITKRTATPPAAITGITTIIGMGASHEAGHNPVAMKAYWKTKYNLDLTYINNSIGGAVMSASRTRWENTKTNYATNPTNYLVFLDPYGNDATSGATTGAMLGWGNMTATQQAQFYTDYKAYAQSILDNGNRLLLMNATFRNYNATTMLNESVGSKAWNDALCVRLCAEMDALGTYPLQSYDGGPFFDAYDISRRYGGELNGWFGGSGPLTNNAASAGVTTPDRIHPDVASWSSYTKFVCDVIACRILGLVPPKFQRVEDPSNMAMRFGAFSGTVACSGQTYANGYMSPVLGCFQFPRSTALGPFRMGNQAYESTDAQMSVLAVSGSGGTVGALNTGDVSDDVTNDLFRDTYWQNTTTTEQQVFAGTGFPPGTYVCRWIGARLNSTANADRGSVRVNGVSSAVYSAAITAGTVPTVQTLTTTVGSDGLFNVYLTGDTLNTRAVMNNMRWTKQ